MANAPKRQTVNYEELGYSTMLQAQALVELLEEKGVLTQREILERVKRLQAQAAKKPNPVAVDSARRGASTQV